jgi:hypothetical protein
MLEFPPVQNIYRWNKYCIDISKALFNKDKGGKLLVCRKLDMNQKELVLRLLLW